MESSSILSDIVTAPADYRAGAGAPDPILVGAKPNEHCFIDESRSATASNVVMHAVNATKPSSWFSALRPWGLTHTAGVRLPIWHADQRSGSDRNHCEQNDGGGDAHQSG